MDYFDSERFEHNGRTFEARLYHDSDHGAPWKNEDGHGPIREIRSREYKRPGERIFCSDDRRPILYAYDWQEAMRIAKRDGWGLGEESRAELARKLKREPTPSEVRAESVRLDFERMRGWVRDDWHYIGVSVLPVDPETDEADESEEFAYALWGIESDGNYWREVARELVDEYCHVADKESAERDYWASRDVATVGA